MKSHSNTFLYELQRQMTTALKSGVIEPPLSVAIAEKSWGSAAGRIGIYQNAYYLRILESLKEDFSRTLEKMGEEEFEQQARNYLQAFSSRYSSLAEVSQYLPEFFRSFSEELFELSSWDWIEVLAARRDSKPRQEKLRLEQIQNGSPFVLLANPSIVSFQARKEVYLCYRTEQGLQSHPLSFKEFRLLEVLSQPKSLEDLAEIISTQSLDPELLQSCLGNWIRDELVFCVIE